MPSSKKYHEYYGSEMDNYSDDMQLWKNLSQSFTQEQRVAIVRKFRQVSMSKHRMTLRQKNAYTMKHDQGLTNIEIAGIMGISVKTVKNHLARANKVLSLIAKEIED